MRSALNALELAVISSEPNEDGVIHITLDVAEECLQKKSLAHDKDGDAHYDVLSAFQKSVRGSDVNAALHYMGRLIEAGDLVSISRRMLVMAYEDIGLASPQAGAHTLAAIQTAEKVGFPEARIPLANAVIELCLSPKSNSAIMAIDAALADIRQGKVEKCQIICEMDIILVQKNLDERLIINIHIIMITLGWINNIYQIVLKQIVLCAEIHF